MYKKAAKWVAISTLICAVGAALFHKQGLTGSVDLGFWKTVGIGAAIGFFGALGGIIKRHALNNM